METSSKAETFVGFCVKARKIRFGANTLSTLKRAYLILVCKTASDNTLTAAAKYAARYRCAALRASGRTLGEIAHKEGVKIAAITDKALAEAVQKFAAPDFELLSTPQKNENLSKSVSDNGEKYGR